MKNFTWSSIDGAIFDLDGTLLDSMQQWHRMGATYLERKDIIPEENLGKKLYANTILQTAEYLRVTYNIDLTQGDIVKECNAVMEDEYNTSVPLKPFVKEFLDLLKAKNIPMYVATATDRHLVEIALVGHGISEYFKGIITSTEAGSAKAESPAIFDMARERLGTSLEKTVIFEDSYHAIKTAHNAGYPIAALYDLAAENDIEEIKKLSTWYSETFEEYVKALL